MELKKASLLSDSDFQKQSESNFLDDYKQFEVMARKTIDKYRSALIGLSQGEPKHV